MPPTPPQRRRRRPIEARACASCDGLLPRNPVWVIRRGPPGVRMLDEFCSVECTVTGLIVLQAVHPEARRSA